MIGLEGHAMTFDETGAPVHDAHNDAPIEAADGTHGSHAEHADAQQGPTAAQLRRFIKSRPYVPLHELRRRFELNGELDEVTAVRVPQGQIFVGLPAREAELLATLVRDGDIGVELSKDPVVSIVVGVFPMRPVTRN
jgi:hypothetical protein